MLTDTQIRKAKATDKPIKLADSGGLYLYIAPSGGKLWRMKYRFLGKEKVLSFGPYPGITIVDARRERDQAKAILREGRDPSQTKKATRAAQVIGAANTFEAIAREWHTLNKQTWTPIHGEDVIHTLERDVFPRLGSMALKEISAPLVLDVLRAIEDRPAVETARRVRQRISAVFVYAIATGRGEADPAAIVQGAMKPLKRGRQPAITDLELAREILRKADATPGYAVTKLALRLLALTGLRPGAIITTPWTELRAIDEDEAVWLVPAARMKVKMHYKDDEARDHLVPLSRQAIEVVKALHALTGRGPFVFPNARHAHKHMSENAIGYLLNRAGYHHKHVPHGWRATFSTIMNEGFPADRYIIDLMLAHTKRDKVEAAYNRAAHLQRRRELAQEWADMLMVDQMSIADVLEVPHHIGTLLDDRVPDPMLSAA